MRTAASHKFLDDVLVAGRTGRDLDDLLMPALHGAIALVQMDDVAVLVAENLHFDVFGARNVFFQEDRRIAEGAFRLRSALHPADRARSAALCTTRMPRPPPPKAALMISGKPISRALSGSLPDR